MTESRSEPAYTRALLIFSACTGMLDAISFIGLDQVFTGNMTGNVLFLAFTAAGLAGLPLVNLAAALCAFIAGSATASLIMRRRSNSEARIPLSSLYILVAGVILTAAAAMSWNMGIGNTEYGVLALTSLLAGVLGAQATCVRPLGNRDINTVVVTMTLVSFAADGFLAFRRSPKTFQRLSAVGAMALGAFIGGVVTMNLGGSIATYLAAGTMFLATVFMCWARNINRSESLQIS